MTAVVQRAGARFVTFGEGWVGRYCFSYDEHYDPENVSFGRLLACNEFVLEPGSGFGLHSHAGVDIVTTVLAGTLTHLHGEAREARRPGSYVLPTGAGVEHDERNDTGEPVRFVQAWLLPDGREQRPSSHLLVEGETVPLDGAERRFLLVLDGAIDLSGRLISSRLLGAGDSARLDEPVLLRATAPGRVLVWDC